MLPTLQSVLRAREPSALKASLVSASTAACGTARYFLGIVGPTTVLAKPASQDPNYATKIITTKVAFVWKQPRPQFAQLQGSSARVFAAAAAQRVRTFPVHRSTFGAEDDGTVQSPTPRIEKLANCKLCPLKVRGSR